MSPIFWPWLMATAPVTQQRQGVLMNGLMTLALAAALMQAETPAVSSSPLAPAFGNTIVSTFPDGRHQFLWLQPDGRWTGIARDGKTLSGRWILSKDGRVCLRQKRPPTLPFSYCARLPHTAALGVSWPAKDVLGRPIELRLVGGIQKSVQSAGPQGSSNMAAPR